MRDKKYRKAAQVNDVYNKPPKHLTWEASGIPGSHEDPEYIF
jgi:hypothetical protein